MDSHYIALILAYAIVTGLWFLIFRFFKTPWSNGTSIHFKKPWLEFIYAIAAVVVILGIGQLYIRDMLLPNVGNYYNNYIDALNQLLIFSPALLLIAIRKQSVETIWLPKSKILIRLVLGLIFASIALLVYWLVRKDAASLGSIFVNTFHLKNISHLVQVFLEDITIALIFVRLAAWIGRKWTIGIVAILFAAAHIPSLLSNGATTYELGSLFFDAFIGVVVLSAVSKSRDVWWFFIVHFVLDMSQFYGA